MVKCDKGSEKNGLKGYANREISCHISFATTGNIFRNPAQMAHVIFCWKLEKWGVRKSYFLITVFCNFDFFVSGVSFHPKCSFGPYMREVAEETVFRKWRVLISRRRLLWERQF